MEFCENTFKFPSNLFYYEKETDSHVAIYPLWWSFSHDP